jgi:hypothetical protein
MQTFDMQPALHACAAAFLSPAALPLAFCTCISSCIMSCMGSCSCSQAVDVLLEHYLCACVQPCRGSWFRLREGRLTGSALANMLSWFDGQDRADHVRLWREKLGLQKPPPRECVCVQQIRNSPLQRQSLLRFFPKSHVCFWIAGSCRLSCLSH